MQKSYFSVSPVLFFLACAAVGRAAAPVAEVTVTVDGAAAGIAVAPTMHGLFYEDINYAADGGLYAELVQNRSFEHADKLYAWSEAKGDGAEGKLKVVDEGGLNANNPNFLRVDVVRAGSGYGVANAGFDGIVVAAGETYRVSLHARAVRAGMAVEVILAGADGGVLARTRVNGIGAGWARHEAELVAGATETKARLEVRVLESGVVDLDMVSLFPAKTFKGRRNGMRADLAQVLADMKPGFLRFPGGCVVEGDSPANAYRWKDTVGDIAERRQNWNLWRNEKSPQYHQTYGLGFFEFFQLAEDLGAEAVPVVNCGMSCQFRNGVVCPPEDLAQWVQDALDLVEFANGAADTKWGALRARMGRAEPFNLKMLGVGNEQWGEDYFGHYAVFHAALKAKYPELRIISTSGPFVGDRTWQAAWEKFRTGTPVDLVDEHYYVPPHWLFANSERYASYDRAGPKVFVGEFAAHDQGRRGTQRAAVAEAAYMTGLLRHADVVEMAAYAPLLAKAGHVQWEPNLVWFDNTQVMRTPSYHVQALFGRNRPDRVLPTTVAADEATQAILAGAQTGGGRAGLGTWNTSAEFKDVEVTGADGKILYRSDFSTTSEGWEFARGQWASVDGTLRQVELTTDRAAYFGDNGWRDYTLRVKARKLAGAEGFMIHFGAGDGALGNWNLGGWGNTQHGLDLPGVTTERVAGAIETGRWYDIRIELSGAKVSAYLDDRLVQTATLAAAKRQPLYAVAGVDDRADEWVVFMANPNAVPLAARIAFGSGGGHDGEREATWTVLAGDVNAVNRLGEPEAISPRTETTRIEVKAGAFGWKMPGNAAGVLRIKRK